jgi:hypothetical protein
MPYPILDPTGTIAADQQKPRPAQARRRKDLHGATVGLLLNTKQNAEPFLEEIGRLLVSQYQAKGTIVRTKVNFAAPAPEDLIKEMAASCDVIVTGICDCGSSSRRPRPAWCSAPSTPRCWPTPGTPNQASRPG